MSSTTAAQRRPRVILATLLLVLTGFSLAAPAHAEKAAVHDEVGDTEAAGLDFTKVVLRNNDHAVVTTMTFAEDRRGEVIVGIRARGHGLVARAVSIHRREGADRVFLIKGSDEEAPCAGLRSTWDRPAARLRIRVPSTCLRDGDYGAVRGWFLTEESGGGGDVDYAPEGVDEGLASMPWIARG